VENLLNVLVQDVYEKKNQQIHYDEEDDIFIDGDGNQMDLTTEKNKLINGIFDRCVLGQTKWFMYGSGKENYKVKHVYKIKYIFNAQLDTIDEMPSTAELVKILCLRNKNKNQTQMKESSKNEFFKSKRIENMANAEEEKEKEKNKKTHEEQVYDLSLVKSLVKLLSKERAEPYDTWRNVGLVLHNISDSLLPD
jgi:hypothetical protein